MNYFRYKLAFSRHQKASRFGGYDYTGDIGDHQLIGVLPNERDFQLGTPNLARRENITIVLSNGSSKDTVLLQLKWRPYDGVVALSVRLTLVLANDVYVYDQAEVYEPAQSSVWPGYIMQYGSNGAALKLFIASPYRRLRLVFRGHMRRNSGDSSAPSMSKFVKLNLVFNNTAGIYDFLHEFDAECFKTIHKSMSSSLTVDQVMTDLLFSDRHEQNVRACGEYTIEGTKSRNNIMVWGFHARQFIDHARPPVKCKRVLAYMMNGQLFHIGNNSLNDGADNIDFGYTSLEVRPETAPIDKPFRVNWDKVSEVATSEWELEISGQGRTLDCKAVGRRFPEQGLSQWFDIEMNDKRGWAWVEEVSTGSASDTAGELDRWKQLVDEYKTSIAEGRSMSGPAVTITDSAAVLVSIADPHCAGTDVVGSKASSLAHLDKLSRLHDEYTVPHAFVLTRFAYDAILRENPQIEQATKRLVDVLIGQKKDEVRQECELVQKLFEQADTCVVPVEVREELQAALKLRYGDRLASVTFAVRSSSWGEDEEDMSAAGQLSTVLGVKGSETEILRAALSCFASKFTYANVEYKRNHGLGQNLPMAVIVQEMIDCDKAGVLFTCEPTSGNTGLATITANYGLGESVVSGQTEPDSIQVRVDPDTGSYTGIERVQIGLKKLVIDGATLAGGGEANQYDRSKCCLSDDEIKRLACVGVSLAKYFRAPRDIEWGFKGDQLYLFQSRPITGLDAYTERELLHELDQSSKAELDFMTRANIGEVIPYPVRPLTQTFFIRMWDIYAARLLTKLQGRVVPVWPECSNGEVFLLAHHHFFNMRCSMLFRASGGEKSPVTRAMEVAFFGHEIGDQPKLVDASRGLKIPENLFAGPRYDVYSLGLKMMPTRVIMREKRLLACARNDVRTLKYAKGYENNKMVGLFNQLKHLYGACQLGWENHIIIIMLANANNASLSMLLAKYVKDPVQLFAAMTKIMGGSPDVISAEIPQRIGSMARIIRAKGAQEVEKFLALSELEALEYVKQSGDADDHHAALSKEFDSFIERFGHRCYNEFDIALRSWRENPSIIVEMLRQNCRSTRAAGSAKKQTTSLDQIVDSLNLDFTFMDRALLKHVIGPKCQNLVASRERTKDILIDHADIMREASRMLAKEMQINMRIPDEDLFYYLLHVEIEPLIREPQPNIVVHATRRRNLFRSAFKQVWLFDEIIEGPEIVPNHMKASKELDATIANAPKLYGTPASCGKAQARVCLVMNYSELDKVQSGDILVAHSTDIGFSPVFPLLSGIVTEVGGLISHGAVVAREYGLPSVLGIPGITNILKDGEFIILDADNGVIIRLNK